MIFILFLLVLIMLVSGCSTGQAYRSNVLPAYDTNKCIDSDNGINLKEKGITQGKYGLSFAAKTDYCNRAGKLVEFYCGRNKVQKTIKDCNGLGEKYICEDGICIKNEKLDNAVDTLVIVNTDVYDISEEEIFNVFEMANNLWLQPKTGVKFNIIKTEFFSFNENCPIIDGWCDTILLLNNYFYEDKNSFPEYVVIFDNEGTARINGGFGGEYSIYWLDPTMGDFYEPESEQKYCSEFGILNYPYNLPMATVDFGHKFAACGYNEEQTQIISDKGVCKGEETNCIWKNGYQMCSNSQDSFYAQDTLILSANVLVHELLHSYADDPIYLEHFSTQCAYDKLGWDPEISFYEQLEAFGTIPPFDDVLQEYAGMCPYVWQQFINSKQDCSE